MYLQYKESIRKEVTPARLRALLKLVTRGHYTRNELENLLQPNSLNKAGSSEFRMIYNFAMATGLIIEEENKYIKLNIGKDIVFDEYQYKNKIIEILLGDREGLFFKMTSWALKQEKNIIKLERARDLVINMNNDNIDARDEDILAWKIWFKYLGYGYNLQNEYIIPNPFKRLGDLIENELEFNNKDRITIREFSEELVLKAPEFKESIKGNNLSCPLSLGLRVLDEQEEIELIYARDTRDIWHLYNMENQILNDISHMRIRGE